MSTQKNGIGFGRVNLWPFLLAVIKSRGWLMWQFKKYIHLLKWFRAEIVPDCPLSAFYSEAYHSFVFIIIIKFSLNTSHGNCYLTFIYFVIYLKLFFLPGEKCTKEVYLLSQHLFVYRKFKCR